MSWEAAAIAAGAELIGGYMSNQSSKSQAQRNREMQERFAKNQISWRVEDARRAGISPLVAMGASTISPAVTMTGSGRGDAIAKAGSHIADYVARKEERKRAKQSHDLAVMESLYR